MSGHFPGLRALVEATPRDATIACYMKNACVYQWNESEKRWAQVDIKPTHYVKWPGEDWREVPQP